MDDRTKRPDDTHGVKAETLLQAEARIDALEAAAAKATRMLAEMVKHEAVVDRDGAALAACVDLLFDELRLEGAVHGEFVRNSMERTKRAVAQLRQSLKEQQRMRT
jgi:hypothetical protein